MFQTLLYRIMFPFIIALLLITLAILEMQKVTLAKFYDKQLSVSDYLNWFATHPSNTIDALQVLKAQQPDHHGGTTQDWCPAVHSDNGFVSISYLDEQPVCCNLGKGQRYVYYKESEQEIAQKITQLVNAGQTPVFCIGETLEQRENNDTNTVIISQVQNIIDMVGLEVFKAVVIAYEPIWAIGTGKTASAEQAQEIHQLIRSYLNKLDAALFSNTAILYGGSVNENNANELIGQPDIDGFLVGGASLKAEAFEQICRSGQTASA